MNEQQPTFIQTDPSVGVRRPKQTGFKVDANGIPLDIIAKQKENKNTAPDDITNDPMFEELFGHVGVEVKDPWKKGGNEDNWISGSSMPIKQQEPAKKEVKQEEIPLEKQIIPTDDPNDVINDPKLKEMLNSKEVINNESDSSDSHIV